jgi:hypothetical protein
MGVDHQGGHRKHDCFGVPAGVDLYHLLSTNSKQFQSSLVRMGSHLDDYFEHHTHDYPSERMDHLVPEILG